jgi:60 kDa SS-A/Ro ribonucleoprotein
MANKELFGSTHGLPRTDTRNRAGGTAYKLSPKEALAQYCATGCFGNTYYASAGEQLGEISSSLQGIDSDFIAKCAVYSRETAYMKDMPAFLLAYLAANSHQGLVDLAFPRVIDNGRMLRNFVQIIRSGQLGRKSFGTALKRTIKNWLNTRTSAQIFRDTVGNDPSMADIIKMVHPKPSDDMRRALYGYILGKEHNKTMLPSIVRHYEAYKQSKTGEIPNVPFQMLDSLGLDKAGWTQVAKNAKWMMTRMNINTFQRHGVFEDSSMVNLIATRLADVEEVKKARAFPYQLMTTYQNTREAPLEITEALQDAMELATVNVPTMEGNLFICPDVSGSMHSRVTGYRGKSTVTQCVDVAALITACLFRKNPKAKVLPFHDRLFRGNPNPRDSIMTTAKEMASFGGGGTNCSLPLVYINQHNLLVDYVVYISDSESWIDSDDGRHRSYWFNTSPTQTMDEWRKIKKRSPQAKMVCIDLTPNTTTQAVNRDDILNIGGFSDAVFDLMASFFEGKNWVSIIENIEL